MNWLNDKCDRAYTLKFSFQNRLGDMTVYYNTNNLFTAFNLDQYTYEKTCKRGFSNTIFFNLDRSLFAKTFLDLKNFKTNSCEIKNQYYGILPQHRSIIQCELQEKIVISSHKVLWDKYPQENNLIINMLRLSLYDQDFVYLIAQRQIIDKVLDKKLIRTSAIQIETENTRKYLTNASKMFSTSQEIKKQDCEDAMRSLFVNDENVTNKINSKKIERCGIL